MVGAEGLGFRAGVWFVQVLGGCKVFHGGGEGIRLACFA